MTSQERPAGVHVVFHKLLRTPYDKNQRQQAILAVLLYKRTQDAPIHPGHWALFGGKVDQKDQDEKEALQRELVDEHELIVNGLPEQEYKELLAKAKHLTNVRVIREDEKRPLISYFEAPLNQDIASLRLGRNPKGCKVEGEGLGWFTEEEIHHLWMRPEDRTALTRFFKLDVR